MQSQTCSTWRAIVLAAAATLLNFTYRTQADDWPGWRGPARSGVSSETGLPSSWSEKQGVLWKVALPGSGISNAIVWGERVFVTSSDGRNQDELHLICLGRDDGGEKWHLRLWGSATTLYHPTKSSMASPSPVTDGEHVFAFYGSGDVVCVDFDGKLVWQRSLASEYGAFENRFAASSSPLLYHDLLLLQCDHYGPSYVLAIDKATGANRWKADRPDVWLSWSSPQLMPANSVPDNGETDNDEPPATSRKGPRTLKAKAVPAATNTGEELLVCGSHRLDAYNPTTGEKLWTVGGMSRECVPTPVFGHGLVFAATGPNGQTVCIRPGGRGDVTGSHVVWSNPRGSPFVPSPIVVGNYLYLVDDKGVGTCLDAKSGRMTWRKRFGGAFTASPVAGDGKLYFCDESGKTIVVATDTNKYRELARNQLDEAIFASPAISQGRLFIRTAEHLYCIGAAP
ncbi:MAG TPA: PQQ-binding-like beta-propeller repeat protein [Pirellulales bacterium]|nr:PQQ-binding-like beta-propeller repeat protein [Pirellulales bacterium]